MTVRNKQAIICGSFIAYLLSLHDKAEQSKGSIIKLRQYILKQTRNVRNIKMVEASNIAWDSVVAKHKDEHLAIVPALVIESLAFSFEEQLKEFFGNDILNLVVRYSEKFQISNINDFAKDSYIVADSLKDATRKVVYDEEM